MDEHPHDRHPDPLAATGPLCPDTTSPGLEVAPPAGSRPWPSAHPVLVPGDRLSGRYRIVRLIARGGMGEIYEADDEALGERVALKTIGAALAASAGSVDRFKREIQLARKVTHPNVCRIFELGYEAAGTPDETLFLTMELLAGETLADRLRRTGPLTPAEALPLVKQMAAGLAAAHEAGIVHRDFKSANVVLVPAARGQGLRAVVGDFGIASALGARDEGAVVGSPAYMAPEQVAGEPVTAATDVYALGVVLFEMVTGRVPFDGGSAADTARRRLSQRAPSPRELAPDLDPRWEAVILRCLERDPARRFASPLEVVQALERGGPGRAARWALAALVVAAVVAVAAWSRRPPASPGPAAVAGPERVAVLGLHLSSTARPDWISATFAEALAAALQSAGVSVVPPGDAERMKLELALADSASYTADSLRRVSAASGATAVVAGGYTRSAGRLQLDLVLQRAPGGEALARLTPSAAEEEITALAVSAAAELAPRLGGRAHPAAATAAVRATLPHKLEAVRPYVEGLFHLRRLDLIAAREALARAAQAAPAFPRSHGALAEVWLALEDPARARVEAALAHRLAVAARDPEAPLLEARLREAEGAWPQAAALYRSAGALPIERGLRLVQAELNAGDLAAARRALEAVRALPPPLNQDPRIDLLEATLTWSQDPERAEAAVERSVREARARGARLVLADALARRAEAAWVRGDFRRMVESVEEARRLHALLGDRKGLANDLNVLSAVRFQQGRLREAARLAGEAAAVQRELGNPEQLAVNVTNEGVNLVRLAELDAANERFDEALRIRAADDPMRGVPILGRAWVATLRGRLEEAERGYAEAERRVTPTSEPYVKGFVAVRYAELLAARGDFAGARRKLDDGLAAMSRLGVKLMMAEMRLAQALALLGEGRPAEAEAVAQAALEDLVKLEAADLESQARALLARSALARGDAAGAQAHAAEALRRLSAHDNRLADIAVRIEAARVECLAGPREAAAASAARLEQVVREAQSLGLAAHRLEAQAVLGACELRAGRAQGERRLAAATAEARASGQVLLAEEARRLRREVRP